MLNKLRHKLINWLLKDVHIEHLEVGEHTVSIDGNNITLPGTVDGVDLSAHAANASAHHAKTTDAGDITSGTFAEARIPAHMAKSKLAWTANKLLKGAGPGNDPTEVDVPSGATLTVAETEVFNGTSPTVWTDLDLSGTVGSNAALVLLKITGDLDKVRGVRKNGDTDEFYVGTLVDPGGYGCACFASENGVHGVLLVATDDTGKIEWITETARATTIDIIAYIKGG